MNNAEMYVKNNEMQKRDVLKCLKEFGTKIKWKHSGESVIDIGCGDGSVTIDIVKKMIPPNYKRIVGCDINEEMVKYSNDRQSRGDIEFTVLNIEGQLPEIMRNSFDHAVSFFALHWVKHQEKAFSNIYELLSEGGECWLMFLGRMVIYEIWRQLAAIDRWQHWLKDVERYIGPYHDSQEPEREIKQIMEKIGFTNVEVITKPMTYVYENVQRFKGGIASLNPFKIPKDVLNDYLDDAVKILRSINEANVNNMGLINTTINYDLLIVSGNK